MARELRIVAPLHGLTGYAKAARALLASALTAGFRVEAVELETRRVVTGLADGTTRESRVPCHADQPLPDLQRAELEAALAEKVSANAPTLIMCSPDGLARWEEYCTGPRIGLTMTEADMLHPYWVRAARNVDALVTVSTWCRNTFRAALPGMPVYVLPVCVDERLWEPRGPLLDIPGRPAFVFFAVFTVQERKQWRKLMQAFAEEFPGEDAGLLLKPSHQIGPVEEMAAWCRARGVWIQVASEQWSEERMSAAYRAIDCYALPSAEGFGNPNVEAMLCGKPAVALAAGGTADVVNAENGYPIPAVWEHCQGLMPQLFRSEYRWPTCEIPDLRRALRQAFEDRGLKCAAVRAIALQRWRRDVIGARLAVIMDEVSAGCPALKCRSETQNPPSRVRDVSSGNPAPAPMAIITTHDHLDVTRRCVGAVRTHTPGAAILLVDDASEDCTREWASCEGVECMACDTHSLSRNRNLALERLRLQRPDAFVVFLDNDTEVTAGWWEALYRRMALNPRIGLLAARQIFDTGVTRSVGCRLRHDAETEPLRLERELVWPDYVETACLAVRPEVWRSLSFDPQFPFWYDDADYCFAARAAGWEVAATAQAVVLHHAHTTSRARFLERDEARRRFLRKWKEAL